MSTIYKTNLLSDTLTIFLMVLVIIFQNSFWPEIFGKHLPLYLWIPCLIYWLLYRTTWKATLMIYFLSFLVAASSTVLISHLLLIHSLIFLITLFFKRVYYTSWTFFSTACAISLLFFPPLLWISSILLENHFYFPPVLYWIGGGMISWLLSFPLFLLLQQTDQLCLKKTHKKII